MSGDLEAKKGIGGVDSISGSTATGAVGGGTDVYGFSGVVTDIEVDGNASVLIDGEHVETNHEHTLTIAATGSYSSYEFTTSGDIDPRYGLGGIDSISGSRASGALSGSGIDSYGFSGAITSLTVDGDAEVYLDGEQLDTSHEHTLMVEANGSYSSYNFSVAGDISPRQAIAGQDSVSGSTASGAISGSGRDVYGLSGKLEDINVDGNADVYLDGEPVGSDLKHTLAVEATGSYSSYTFSVSGDLEAKEGIAGVDRINGSTGSGAVGDNGRDAYNFSGAITDLGVDGSANVYLDGESLDTSHEHTLMIEATGSYSSYEFSVTGDISVRQGIAGKDVISGSTASGAVGSNGQDVYGFSGEIADFKMDGNANIYKNGNQISPDSIGGPDLKLGYNARNQSHDRGNTYENFDGAGTDWTAIQGRAESRSGDWGDESNDNGHFVLISEGNNERVEAVMDTPSVNFAYRDVSMAVRLRGTSNETLRVELAAGDGSEYQVTTRYLSEKHGWVRIGLGPSRWSGTPDLADINEFSLSCYTGGKTCEIDVDDVRTTPKRDGGAAMFIFDDANESDYTVAYDMMSDRGMMGSTAVIPSAVGNSGKLSQDQIDEMDAAGWAWPSHPQRDSPSDGLGSIPTDEAEQEMRDNKQWVLNNTSGRGANTLVWPFGDFNEDSLNIAGQYYELSFGGGSSTSNGIVTEASWVPRVNTDDIENSLEALEQAYKTETVCVLMAHGVGGSRLSKSDFRRLLDKVEQRNLDVLTTDEFAAEQ